jgi:molybdopterin-guanine dinucleotide biosynthesis protein B
MRAVSVVGFKDSGKTGAAVDLAAELKGLGQRVATVKFSGSGFDKADTDTDRLLAASHVTAGISDVQSAVFWPERKFLHDLLPLFDADILVVEGGKDLGWLPRILVLREPGDADGLGRELALGTYGEVRAEGLRNFADASAAAQAVLAKGFSLPALDCGACGREDCRGLAVDILAGKAQSEDCTASNSDMSITVNGSQVGLNPFVRDIIAGSLKGMLKSLKGYAPGRVEIVLEDKDF